MIYFILFMIMVIVCFICKKEELNNKFYKIFMVILTLLLVFRYGQGTDYFNYEYIFNYVNTINDITLVGDIGFNILILFCKSIGISYIGFNAIVAIISMYLINLYINKYSTNKMVSLTLFYPLFYIVYWYSAIRQGLAMSIFCGILIPFLLEKKYVKYVLGVIFAAMFHLSSIFLLGFLVLSFIDLVKIRNFVVVMAGVVVFKFLGLQNLIINLMPAFLKDRLIVYLDGDISITALATRVIFLLIIVWLYYNGTQEQKDENRKSLSIYLWGFIMYLVLMNSTLISSRLNAYIKIIEIILIANFIPLYIVKKKDIINSVALGLLVYIMLIKNIGALLGQGDYYSFVTVSKYPYVSIFNKEDIFTYRNVKYRETINIFFDKFQWPVGEMKEFEELPTLDEVKN